MQASFADRTRSLLRDRGGNVALGYLIVCAVMLGVMTGFAALAAGMYQTQLRGRAVLNANTP